MPCKRSGCRRPKLRSFFKVDDQTSRRRSLGESEIPEAVAMLLRLTGFSSRPSRIQKPLNGLNDRARSSNRICRFLDRGELFACKFNFKDSLESQAVILLARADGAGEFCDATTRATGDQ